MTHPAPHEAAKRTHTPGPYYWHEGDLWSKQGRMLLWIDSVGRPSDRDEQSNIDDAFILAALNAHDELVAACKAALLHIRHGGDCNAVTAKCGEPSHCTCGAAKVADDVRAALFKAGAP